MFEACTLLVVMIATQSLQTYGLKEKFSRSSEGQMDPGVDERIKEPGVIALICIVILGIGLLIYFLTKHFCCERQENATVHIHNEYSNSTSWGPPPPYSAPTTRESTVAPPRYSVLFPE